MVDRRSAVKSQVVTTIDCIFIIVATITRISYIKDMDRADHFSRAMECCRIAEISAGEAVRSEIT